MSRNLNQAPHAISRNGVEACIIPEAADGRVYRGSQGKVTGGHEERRGDHTRRDDVKNMSKGHSGVLEKDRECVQNQRQDLHDEKQDDIEEALGKRRGVGLWGRYRRGSSSSGGGKGAVGLPRRGPEKKQNISQGSSVYCKLFFDVTFCPCVGCFFKVNISNRLRFYFSVVRRRK